MKRIGLFLIAICALYTGTWFVLAGMAEDRIMAQLTAEGAHGVAIISAAHHKSGFPFSLAVTLDDFTARSDAGLTLQAPSLTLADRFVNWSHVTLRAHQGATIMVPPGAARPEIDIAISSIDGALDFGTAGVHDAGLMLNGVTATGLLAGAGPVKASQASLSIDRPDEPPVDDTKPGAHAIFNINNIALPPPAIPALGNAIRRLTVEAVVMGQVPALSKSSLAPWRDAGGTVELHELSTEWGPLGLGLGGTLSLDQDMQPEGAFNAKVTGFDAVVSVLAGAGQINQNNAHMLSMGLGLLAKPEGPDQTPTLTVPLSIQDRTLYVSAFKVAHVPEVRVY